jgi:hypothetical protein
VWRCLAAGWLTASAAPRAACSACTSAIGKPRPPSSASLRACCAARSLVRAHACHAPPPPAASFQPSSAGRGTTVARTAPRLTASLSSSRTTSPRPLAAPHATSVTSLTPPPSQTWLHPSKRASTSLASRRCACKQQRGRSALTLPRAGRHGHRSAQRLAALLGAGVRLVRWSAPVHVACCLMLCARNCCRAGDWPPRLRRERSVTLHAATGPGVCKRTAQQQLRLSACMCTITAGLQCGHAPRQRAVLLQGAA